MTPKDQLPEETGRTVYARTPSGEFRRPARFGRRNGAGAIGDGGGGVGGNTTSLAPTLTPLVIGLTVLLILVVGLGVVSVVRLDAVSSSVLSLQRQQSDRLNYLLKLRGAVTVLNNEARARAEGQARKEVVPFFSVRLRRARETVTELLPRFDAMPQAQTERGQAFRRQLTDFVEVTRDTDEYGERGYDAFAAVDAEFEEMLRESDARQEEVLERSRALENEAERDIVTMTVMAFLFGLVTTFGTIFEVQRRFRQMREGLEAARRERQFSTQTLGGMVSAVAAIDGRDRIRSANAAFYKVFPDAAIGASVHEKISSPEGLKILEAATASRPADATYLGRYKVAHIRDEEDDPRAFDLYTSPLLIDDDPGMIITLVDVSEAAKAERELRHRASLAAVGQAVAQVAHEIKNPIGSVRLGISMLRDMVREDEAAVTINLVERGIEHLTKIAQDITQFSRQKPLKRAPVGLNALLEESLELVADRVRDKHTPIEKKYSAAALDGLWDEDELRQVFVNLFANALDASEAGAALTVTTERVEARQQQQRPLTDGATQNGNDSQPYARVTITDRGCGMDEKTRARLFEPFFTTKPRGTGLGLAIVKKIIDQHDGHISAKSVVDEGTRFSVELPLSD